MLTDLSPSYRLSGIELFDFLLTTVGEVISLIEYRAGYKASGRRIEDAHNIDDALRAPTTYATKHSLVGEEFRVIERDADYLRLRGRGGDEYLAWDFVLGVLDKDTWVVAADDGLYRAYYKDGIVRIAGPFYEASRSLLEVRGPPYMPFYPVVPVRWVRKALEKIREKYGVEPYIFTPPAAPEEPHVGLQPVEPEVLLKWPLRDVEWNFKIKPKLIPPNGGDDASIIDCNERRVWTCREVPIMCSDELEVQIRGVDYQEKYHYTHIVSL